MSELIRSRKKFGLLMGIIFLFMTLLSGAVAWFIMGGFQASAQSEEAVEAVAVSDQQFEDDFSPEPEPEPVADPVRYNIPGEMRGVYLVPGYDFLTNLGAGEAAIKAEVDTALANAKKLTMNTVVIDTVYLDEVIFDTSGTAMLDMPFDVMEYIANRTREEDLYLYVIFDASLVEDSGSGANAIYALSSGNFATLSSNLLEFIQKYEPDAFLIDGYMQTEQNAVDYETYLLTGGAIGYGNYIRQSPAAVVKTAAKTVRAYAPNIQIGLLAEAVWANESDDPAGSPTNATFTSLNSGNADTKSFVEEKAVDFVAVKAFGSLTDSAQPFETVVSWWADVARNSGVPMYVVHASSRAVSQNEGWDSGDQLTRQVMRASGVSGYAGSIFNSLSRLVSNPGNAASTLTKYYDGEVKSEHVLTELAITKPNQTSFTTQETSVTFTGASDPTEPVTINGDTITTDQSGYFTVNYNLVDGQNIFTIKHKDKTLTYTISRNVEILKEITPTGTITTDGGMSIAISALAYADATVYATVAGSTVPMSIDENAEDEASRDSSFRTFVGYYTAPAATSSQQDLGAISVTGSWQGNAKTLTGATIKVNRKAKIEDGVPIVVIADQAVTYPANTLDNVPSAEYYPIPKGAMDYAVGEEITYVKDSTTHKYTVLASGLRVESADIQAISNDYPAGNAISGINVSTEGRYTYVTVKTAQKVTYKISYSGSAFKITFHNTTGTPNGSTALNSNAMFTQAVWGDASLSLTLAKTDGFMGYKGYYDSSGNLVFRFNTPPSSLSNARIAVDAGHGGNDYGAIGFLSAYPEKVLNKAIAQKVVAELEARGATVLLIENSGNPSLKERVAQAEAFNADFFVSIHNNTGTRLSAIGTETYYFYPYARNLATALAKQVSGGLGSENRGAKRSYYHITLSAQVPSVLVECGFMTNQAEYEKLISESYQQAIADGIVEGLSAGINSAYTGVASSGSQSVGNASATQDTGDTRLIVSTGDAELEDISFGEDVVRINKGSDYTLEYFFFPADADVSGITFKSGNTSVATVANNGKVTALKEGTAKITLSTADGSLSTSCTVEVVESGGYADAEMPTASSANNSGLALNKTANPYFAQDTVSVYRSSTAQLEIQSDFGKVRPGDFQWESEDTSIATVDSYGRVTAKKIGTVDIFAYTVDDEYYLSCTIKVTNSKVPVSRISLDKTELFLVTSGSDILRVNFSPVAATNQKVTFKSSNRNIALVDSNGRVTANRSGTAIITATSADGNKTATCEVTVSSKNVPIEEISFVNESEAPVEGDSYYLEYEIYPYNATNREVTWKSSDSTVVSVDENGRISCLQPGTAIITVSSAANSKIKATVTIYVDW